jgi:hypothetical protein
MIIKQGGLVAIAGVIVGLGLAYTGSRFIASLLYGVSDGQIRSASPSGTSHREAEE